MIIRGRRGYAAANCFAVPWHIPSVPSILHPGTPKSDVSFRSFNDEQRERAYSRFYFCCKMSLLHRYFRQQSLRTHAVFKAQTRLSITMTCRGDVDKDGRAPWDNPNPLTIGCGAAEPCPGMPCKPAPRISSKKADVPFRTKMVSPFSATLLVRCCGYG